MQRVLQEWLSCQDWRDVVPSIPHGEVRTKLGEAGPCLPSIHSPMLTTTMWCRNQGCPLCSAHGRRLLFAQIREGRGAWPSHWLFSAQSFRWGVQSIRITGWDVAPCMATHRVDAALVQLRGQSLAPAAQCIFIFTCACCGSRAGRSPWSGWAETNYWFWRGAPADWGEGQGKGNGNSSTHPSKVSFLVIPPKGMLGGSSPALLRYQLPSSL